MLTMDQPPLNQSSQEVTLVAQASPSNTVHTVKRGQLGICYQVHNSPTRIITHDGLDQELWLDPAARPEQTGMVPYLGLLYYFRRYGSETLRPDSSKTYPFEVRIIKAPKRGQLKEENCELISKDCHPPVFYYQPQEKGIYGRDYAIIEIKTGEHSLRVHYHIDMMDSLYFRRFDDYCGRDKPVWKISLGSGTPIFQAEAGGLTGSSANIAPTIDHSERVAIAFKDLPYGELGESTYDQSSATITLSPDAAGHGWFIDATPTLNEEFLPTSHPNEWIARPGSAAEDRIDLVTVLLHEYAHTLGLEHNPDPHHTLAATLAPGGAPHTLRGRPEGPAASGRPFPRAGEPERAVCTPRPRCAASLHARHWPRAQRPPAPGRGLRRWRRRRGARRSRRAARTREPGLHRRPRLEHARRRPLRRRLGHAGRITGQPDTAQSGLRARRERSPPLLHPGRQHPRRRFGPSRGRPGRWAG
jgi:hypothetical protein